MSNLHEIFRFPNPVNETAARVVAGGVVTMAGATLALDQPWLMVPLAYGFAARVAAGPRFSPLGLFATRVVVPRLPLEHRMVPGPPKRLAQGMGLVLSGTAAVLHFGFGKKRAAYRVLGVLTLAATLESVLGICLACRLFPYLMKWGLVPASVCEECADLGSRADVATAA